MTIERVITVTHVEGLHARPAREVVDATSDYDADVVLRSDGRDARATSPLELTALGVEPGTDVEIRADGPDASAAVAAISAVLTDDEADTTEEGES